MRVTCPCCYVDFPIEAGFSDADGKRLAALMAEFEPALGRAVISYLRLFKPLKTGLRVARAIKIVSDLIELVRSGTVCRDERNGARRPAAPPTWTAGIEQMLAQAGLETPLQNHQYLRAVVYGIADQADAQAERAREEGRRAPRRADTGVSPTRAAEDPQTAHLAWLKSQLQYELMTQAEYDDAVASIAAQRGAS